MTKEVIVQNKINEKIYFLRGVYVMLDRDLSALYQVETRTLNQAVKRNQERFPSDFMFQLTQDELEEWMSQIVISNKEKMGMRKKPYAFTEQGVAMLSGVLKSKIAITTSIHIIQTFVQMRRFIADNALVHHRLEKLEKQHSITTTKLEHIFQAIEDKNMKAQSGIFYDGQVFDAHVFVSDLMRHAKKSIILIDNYIDDTVLTQLSKAKQNVNIYLLTKNASNALKLDIKKYNEQYSNIVLVDFSLAHDRFLILDENEIYHIGASLKDLGKKWFAFSKITFDSFGLMEKVRSIMHEQGILLE